MVAGKVLIAEKFEQSFFGVLITRLLSNFEHFKNLKKMIQDGRRNCSLG